MKCLFKISNFLFSYLFSHLLSYLFFCLFSFLLTFSMSSFCFAGDSISLKLQGSVKSNFEHKCNFAEAIENADSSELFIESLKNTNFDPLCLGPEILTELNTNKKKVNGFFSGISSSFTMLFGGRQLVILKEKNTAGVKVAVFQFRGVSANLALPVGYGVSSGILYGRCDQLTDYTGYFKTVELFGAQNSLGMSSSILTSPKTNGFSGAWERLVKNHIGAKKTECNTISLELGAQTTLGALAMSHYRIVSPIVHITGDRVKKLHYLFHRANRDSFNRFKNVPDKQYNYTDHYLFYKKWGDYYELPQRIEDALSFQKILKTAIKSESAESGIEQPIIRDYLKDQLEDSKGDVETK